MTKNQVAKKKKNAVTTPMNFEDDSNAGMENIDGDSIAIPFIKILQKLSPQADDENEQYIKGAKPGMFFHTVTEDMFKRIVLIPCHYERLFNEWVPREQGGGYKGSLTVTDFEHIATSRNDKGQYVIEDSSNYLMDTRNHYCLLLDEDTGFTEQVIFSLTSTHLKVSRKWMSKIASIKLDEGNGFYTPPSFSHKYEVTTISQENSSGSWKLAQVSTLGPLGKGEETIYEQAKSFYELVKSGKVKATEPVSEDAEM